MPTAISRAEGGARRRSRDRTYETPHRSVHGRSDVSRVVADVERYPEFLPWVVALRDLVARAEGAREIMMAEMAGGLSGACASATPAG